MNNYIVRILLICLVFIGSNQQKISAQSKAATMLSVGVWKGTITINAERVFNIAIEKIDNNGQPKYFFHSIDQNSYNFPIRKIAIINDSLSLFISSLNANIILQINEHLATGFFTQRDIRFPVKLEKTSQTLQKPSRPQEPLYPLAYNEEEVLIKNTAANISLAGSITYPKDKQQHAAVLLIPGSGPSDRDQSIFGHKNFLVLADILTRNGYVVLRMDDRGAGESTGIYDNTSIKDFANDASTCVKYLKNRKEVNANQVGVLGHSAGADIAAYLAANNNEVKFVVLMAGSAEMLSKTIIRQTEKIYTEKGASATAVALNTTILNAVFDVVKQEPNDSIAMEKIATVFKPLNEKLAAIGAKEQELIETNYPLSANNFGNMLSGGMRFDLFYNPASMLTKIKQPILVMQGAKDIQVMKDNSDVIMKLLKQKNHSAFTKQIVFPSVNHLFQQCKTGSIDEYQQIEETISSVVVDDLIQWLKKVVLKNN